MNDARTNPKMSRWRRLFQRDRESVHGAIESGRRVTEPAPRRRVDDTQQGFGQPIEEPAGQGSLESEAESATQRKSLGAARRLESESSQSDIVTPVDPTPPMPPNARSMSQRSSAQARSTVRRGTRKNRSRARRAKR